MVFRTQFQTQIRTHAVEALWWRAKPTSACCGMCGANATHTWGERGFNGEACKGNAGQPMDAFMHEISFRSSTRLSPHLSSEVQIIFSYVFSFAQTEDCVVKTWIWFVRRVCLAPKMVPRKNTSRDFAPWKHCGLPWFKRLSGWHWWSWGLSHSSVHRRKSIRTRQNAWRLALQDIHRQQG